MSNIINISSYRDKATTNAANEQKEKWASLMTTLKNHSSEAAARCEAEPLNPVRSADDQWWAVVCDLFTFVTTDNPFIGDGSRDIMNISVTEDGVYLEVLPYEELKKLEDSPKTLIGDLHLRPECFLTITRTPQSTMLREANPIVDYASHNRAFLEAITGEVGFACNLHFMAIILGQIFTLRDWRCIAYTTEGYRVMTTFETNQQTVDVTLDLTPLIIPADVYTGD